VPVLGGTELSVPGLDVTMTLIDIEPQISYNFGLPIKLCNFIPEIKIVF